MYRLNYFSLTILTAWASKDVEFYLDFKNMALNLVPKIQQKKLVQYMGSSPTDYFPNYNFGPPY
jgi:hypothetical protein